jgi:hypothetical protein
MVPKAYQRISNNLKEAALHMTVREYRNEEILKISQFSPSTLKHAARRKHLTSAYRVQKKTNTVLVLLIVSLHVVQGESTQ